MCVSWFRSNLHGYLCSVVSFILNKCVFYIVYIVLLGSNIFHSLECLEHDEFTYNIYVNSIVHCSYFEIVFDVSSLSSLHICLVQDIVCYLFTLGCTMELGVVII